MRLCWGFLREHKERVKNLRKGRQDSLRSLGGYGEDRERNEMEGVGLKVVAEIC